MPELEEDIAFKQIKLEADVNKENYLEQQTVQAVVTGKDKQGKTHEVSFSVMINVTDYNQTSVTSVKFPTEKIVELEMDHGHSTN